MIKLGFGANAVVIELCERMELSVLIVHDFDYPLHTRKTCLKKAFWLIVYALFGRSKYVRSKMPKWLMYEKYSQAKALALFDKTLRLNAIFAFRKEIDDAFPTLRKEIEDLGIEVVNHWHTKEPVKGFNEWKARGAWDRLVDRTKTYMNYDRYYVMSGQKVAPEDGTSVCWHVDHMPYNLFYYLQFIKDEGERVKK